MKRIFTPVLCLLLCCTFSSHAQSDSTRYKSYLGTYTISTPTFPVSEVKVYWQDSVLAFKAGGARGTFTPGKGGQFSFNADDHAGTVTFSRNRRRKVIDILIVMDGGTYLGTKKL
jgi:hypothetical protein